MEDILKEITKLKEEKNKLQSIEILSNVNIDSLKKLTEEYIQKSIKNEFVDEDYGHWFLEECVTTFYGKDFWNKKRKISEIDKKIENLKSKI